MQSQSNRRRQFWHAWDFRTPINRSTHNIMSCILNISFILIMIDRINFTWRFNVSIVELYSGSSWKHWRLWLHLISFTYYSVCRLIESSDNRRWKSNNYIWVDHLTVICRNKPLNVDSCAWNAGARIKDFTTSIQCVYNWAKNMAFVRKLSVSFMLSWIGQTRHDNSSKNFVQNFVW